MKTPGQIADESMKRRGHGPDAHGYGEAYTMRPITARRIAVEAIEADRAQRAENTITIELDAEHRPEETVAEILRQIEAGNTSGYYPNWEMQYDEPEEAES